MNFESVNQAQFTLFFRRLQNTEIIEKRVKKSLKNVQKSMVKVKLNHYLKIDNTNFLYFYAYFEFRSAQIP